MATPEVSRHTATVSPSASENAGGAQKHSPYPPSDMMNISATAAHLNRSRPWVYLAMREMGLPAIRMGKRWMTQRSKIDEWVASQPGVNLPTSL